MAQTRQVGTLKAVGVTPRQVVLALLVESLTLAGLATAVGLGAGRVIGPRLASTSLTVFGQPDTPAPTWGRAAIVAGVAATVVGLATVRPAVHGLGTAPCAHWRAALARPDARAGWHGGPQPWACHSSVCWACGQHGVGRVACSPTPPGSRSPSP